MGCGFLRGGAKGFWLSSPETPQEAESWEMVNTLVPILEAFIGGTGVDPGHTFYRFNNFHAKT